MKSDHNTVVMIMSLRDEVYIEKQHGVRMYHITHRRLIETMYMYMAMTNFGKINIVKTKY